MKHTSKTLTNAMLTTNNGKIDPNLIPPRQFLRVLQDLQRNIPAHLTLITPVQLENLHVFYDIGKASAVIIDHTIRIFIEIPLKASEREFTLLKQFQSQFLLLRTKLVRPTLPYQKTRIYTLK